MTVPSRSLDILYFCDESSQVTDDFAAVAGLALPRTIIPKVSRDLTAIKLSAGKKGEVKWSNAKSYGGRVHAAYIDYLFLLIAERKASFHIRFSPMNDYDHRLSGPRRKVDTISKAFYQLILHRPMNYYRAHRVFVHPDDGEYTELLPAQIGALRYQARSHYDDQSATCLQLIERRSSEREPMLQLLDVTLGALAAMRNGRTQLPGYSQIKCDLVDRAFRQTGWPSIFGNCPPERRNVSRWNVKPSIKSAA